MFEIRITTMGPTLSAHGVEGVRTDVRSGPEVDEMLAEFVNTLGYVHQSESFRGQTKVVTLRLPNPRSRQYDVQLFLEIRPTLRFNVAGNAEGE